MRIRLICAGAAAAWLGAAAPFAAAEHIDAAEAARLEKSGELMPLPQILERIRGEHPGNVVETELEHDAGRYIYEIEMVDGSGTKRELKVDAKTGEVLAAEDEDEDEDED